MKIIVAITNHNQNLHVKACIDNLLYKQTVSPDIILVCTDAGTFKTNEPRVICIDNRKKNGRCRNRNSAVDTFTNISGDALIFLDGDSIPKENDFIKKYTVLLEKYDLIFGTREHTDISGIKTPPSDLLTANMDELWQAKPLNYSDLRVVSGAVKSWQESTSFDEKADLMVTGMIAWSCNFGFTRKGLEKYLKFRKNTYGTKELFDTTAFDGGWGYEDVAMGLDALYAGLSIFIDDDIKVSHNSHERKDGLFDHVKGRHKIMDRYRLLEKTKSIKNKLYAALIVLFGIYITGIITGLVTMAITLEN